MKNFLFNNYSIKIDKIYNDNNKYFFICDEKIFIIETNSNKDYLDKLFDLTNNMYSNGIMVETFIINNNGEPYTKRNNSYIILLKDNNRIDNITIKDILLFQNVNNNLELYNILEEWKKEVDIIEEEMIEYNKEYQLIQNSLDYFIGLAENAIELVYEIRNELNSISNSIGHKLFYKMFDNYKLWDPFTFIKVNKMYDISNYIKYKFYKNELDYEEIDKYLNSINDVEKIYLFSCLLYPNIYFDLVKSVLLEEEKEEKINIFIKRINDYKELLIYFKNKYKSVNVINLINWIC